MPTNNTHASQLLRGAVPALQHHHSLLQPLGACSALLHLHRHNQALPYDTCWCQQTCRLTPADLSALPPTPQALNNHLRQTPAAAECQQQLSTTRLTDYTLPHSTLTPTHHQLAAFTGQLITAPVNTHNCCTTFRALSTTDIPPPTPVHATWATPSLPRPLPHSTRQRAPTVYAVLGFAVVILLAWE